MCCYIDSRSGPLKKSERTASLSSRREIDIHLQGRTGSGGKVGASLWAPKASGFRVIRDEALPRRVPGPKGALRISGARVRNHILEPGPGHGHRQTPVRPFLFFNYFFFQNRP